MKSELMLTATCDPISGTNVEPTWGMLYVCFSYITHILKCVQHILYKWHTCIMHKSVEYLTIILYLIGSSVNSFKLPSVTLDTDINNVHDQFTDSIVNSTVTSINLSIIHVASEVILLILIIYSYKRLSKLILELSTQLVNTRRMVKNACKNQSSEDEVES